MADFTITELSPKARYSKFSQVIGQGAYKTVSQAYDLDLGIFVAWNDIPLNKLNDVQKEKIRDEIQMLVNLKEKHPRLLNIKSFWLNKETNTVVFISDLYLSGSLRSFLQKVKRIKVKIIKRWVSQILDGLRFLHERSIIHRDLKCDNIFYDGTTGNLVIGDFGISRVTSDTGNASTILGTPEFMAPEVYDEKYNQMSDIYSLGMCILEIATGEVPYSECVNVAQVWRKVTSNIKPEAIGRIPVGSLCDLITRCLRYDHTTRPTVAEIQEHEFFQESEHDEMVIEFGAPPVPEVVVVAKTVEDEIEEALRTESHLEESNVEENVSTHSGQGSQEHASPASPSSPSSPSHSPPPSPVPSDDETDNEEEVGVS